MTKPTIKEALEALDNLEEWIVKKNLDNGNVNKKTTGWASKIRKALEQQNQWQPIEDWHEDIGNCLWMCFRVDEPYGAGTPLDDVWVEDYYTHFIPMSVFDYLLDGKGMPLPPPPEDETEIRKNAGDDFYPLDYEDHTGDL